MMKNIILTTLFLFSIFSAIAQSFSESNIPLQGVFKGSVAIGDYDNDHDADILIMGSVSSASTTLYRNDNGTLTPVVDGHIGHYSDGSAAWGDYDKDGLLDLVICGMNSSYERETTLYRNNGTQFDVVDAPFVAVKDASLSWNDFDNDNDLDLLIAGNDGTSYERNTTLYRNDNGTFIAIETPFIEAMNSTSAWGDVDNDGDQDLFLSGNSDFISARLYYNDGNEAFTEKDIQVQAVFSGKAIWVDMNADGFKDLAIVGNNEYIESEGVIYENYDGSYFLSSNNFSISGTALGSIAACDYDNDGDHDLVECGKGSGCGLVLSKLYDNIDNNLTTQAEDDIPSIHFGTCDWIDVDNDGFSEIVLAGTNGSGSAYAKILHNDLGPGGTENNSAPTTPTSEDAIINEQQATFSWSPATDVQTPQPGLTYNLRVGTTPGGNEIVSSMALEDGKLLLPQEGNRQNATSWTLRELNSGTYYWSVQAVDNSYASSAFCEEQSFEIESGVGVAESATSALTVFPNPCSHQLTVNSLQTTTYAIFSLDGRVVSTAVLQQGENSIDVSVLQKGSYILKAEESTIKFVKE